MVNRQNFTLLFMLLAFCFLHAAHAASTRFQIRSHLLQPLLMHVDKEKSAVTTSSPQKNTPLATFSTESGLSDNSHASLDTDNTVLICQSDDCKGKKLRLSNLLLNDQPLNNIKSNFSLNGTEKLAWNGKSGNYSGNLLVSLAAA